MTKYTVPHRDMKKNTVSLIIAVALCLMIVLYLLSLSWLCSCRPQPNTRVPRVPIYAQDEETLTRQSRASSSTDPSFVLFYADWCPNCKQTGDSFRTAMRKSYKQESSRGTFVFANIDTLPGCVGAYEIQTIPRVMMFTGPTRYITLTHEPGALEQEIRERIVHASRSVSRRST